MNFDSKEVKKQKAPVLFIELCDQRDSGWVLDGTEGTINEQRLSTPSVEFLPNKGFRLAKDPITGEFYNEEIRYIKNQRIISVAEQRQKGINPSRNKLEDKIMVKGGNFSVERAGSFISLYDFLMDSFYNESNPHRPEGAKAIYRIKEIEKEEELVLDRDLAYAEAVQFLGTLALKRGDGYVYNEEKINSLCQLFTVYSQTLSGKILGLKGHAQKDPMGFLDKALRFEQTKLTEISHALELSLIHFDGNTAVYSNKDKVIADLGRGNLSQDKKISKLADLFGTDEYKSAYQEFQIELEAAKEKLLK